MIQLITRMGIVLHVGILTLSFGCSDTRQTATPFNPETGKHSANWIVGHRAAFLSDSGQCAACHGADLRGGISGVSCFSASFDGMSCHANGPSMHPANWTNPELHGTTAKSAPGASAGLSYCQACHGDDFAGGLVQKSCVNVAGCHGAGADAPHAFPWVPGSTYVHTTTDAGNAPVCGLCHLSGRTPPSYAALPAGTTPGCFDNTLCHGTAGDCVSCHSSTQAIAHGPLAGTGSRRAVALEFANTWSHKRSAGGVVTKYDCIVCHMEGDMATGSTNAAYHKNGLIDLRDPDTGVHIKGVTHSGTAASVGAYSSTGADAAPARFSRDLSLTFESDPDFNGTAAIMINLCLKCHDADGALSALAQVPGGSAFKPFATAITGHAAPFNSNGNGNVVNVAGSFATTNAAYHPVMGKGNNSYTQGARMSAPWTLAKTNGNNTQYGNLLSCWDCHAPNGISSSATLTMTVTAHGAPTILRAPVRAGGNTAALNLCLNCHAAPTTATGYLKSGNHGTGSAFASGGSSGDMTSTVFTRCYNCHGYNGAAGATVSAAGTRPNRAEDVHGFNDRTPGTTGSKWPSGSRPYAFIRNTLSNWAPLSAAGDTITGAHTCTGTGGTCGDDMSNDSYSPGGAY